MVRQARSEATRRKIVTSAVDLISEIGYAAAGLGDIIDRAEMTKGALYYHFDSKEALATTIMEEGGTNVVDVFRSVGESSSPALESIVHGVFVAADYLQTDKMARVGTHLLRAFGEFNATAGRIYGAWLAELTKAVKQAGTEGDLRTDLNPDAVAELVLSVVLGTEVLSSAQSGGSDLRQRMAHRWEVLLPCIVSDESLDYFREFLAREALRQAPISSAE